MSTAGWKVIAVWSKASGTWEPLPGAKVTAAEAEVQRTLGHMHIRTRDDGRGKRVMEVHDAP